MNPIKKTEKEMKKKWWTKIFGLCKKPFDSHNYIIEDGEIQGLILHPNGLYFRKCYKCGDRIGEEKKYWEKYDKKGGKD